VILAGASAFCVVSKYTRRMTGQISVLGSFVRGASTVFDLHGSTHHLYSPASSASEADRRTMAENWSSVFEDLHVASDRVRHAARR